MSHHLSQLRWPTGGMIGHAVMELMGGQEIPATGPNYEVWLNYYLGEPPALKEEIDTRLKAGLPFDDETNEALHERFFSQSRLNAEIALSSDRMAQHLAQMVSAFRTAGDKTSDFAKLLDEASVDLQAKPDAQALEKLTEKLATATLLMKANNETLTRQLDDASREVDQMRVSMHRLKNESLTDGLTGIANRRMFDQTLRLRMTEAAEQKTPLCLLLCDIDHFKRFNDTWGHATGDQVLRFIAATLKQYAQGDATAARYGGEEFALILPRTTLAEAQRLADQMRNTIETKRLKRKSTGDELGRVTISGGLAELRPNDCPQEVIKRADACLYAAKRGGRNRICADNDPRAVSAA